MAIQTKIINGKKFYEVYASGTDRKGRRIQRRRRSVESFREAQKVEFEFAREIAKLKDETIAYTWAEWFEIALARVKRDFAASTAENYQASLHKWVTPHWENKEIKSITREDIHRVVFDSFDQKLSPHTRKTLLKLIRRVLEMAVEDGALERNPSLGIKMSVPEVEQKVLTNEEVRTFLQVARDTSHRFYPIWVMALMTGMRSGELYALNWSDIDLEARLISVSKQWTSKVGIGPTKSRRTRMVPISEELLLFLKEYRLQSATENVLPRHNEWETGMQAAVTREFCVAINVTSVKFHDLRATFITNLLSRGVPLAVVMAIVGHSQIKTTNGYLRKAGVDVRGGTDKLGYGVPEERRGTLLEFTR